LRLGPQRAAERQLNYVRGRPLPEMSDQV